MRADDKTNLDWPHFDPVTVEEVIREMFGYYKIGMRINKRNYVRLMQRCIERYKSEGRPIIPARQHNRLEALMERQADTKTQKAWAVWIAYFQQTFPEIDERDLALGHSLRKSYPI